LTIARSIFRIVSDDDGDLGHPVYKVVHVPAKLALQLRPGHDRVLQNVVEQRRGDRRRIELHVDEDFRHLQGMDEVGLSRIPILTLVQYFRLSGG